MLIFRWLLFLCLIASALSFAFYLGTGKLHYRRWGFVVLKWTILAALAFFAVLAVSQFSMN